MRSGSSFSRYSAFRSCARFRGPPVTRTEDKGNGRATSGIAFLIAWAWAMFANRNKVSTAASDFIFIATKKHKNCNGKFLCFFVAHPSYTFVAPATLGANGLQVLLSLNANVTHQMPI